MITSHSFRTWVREEEKGQLRMTTPERDLDVSVSTEVSMPPSPNQEDDADGSMARRIAVRLAEQVRENLKQEVGPTATYRLQFHRGFTFQDAAMLAPYLSKLGITHIYASPYLKARSGSLHGYDIVDHTQLNPEVGGEAGFEEFVASLQQHGLRQVLDFVPNHMGVGSDENSWWQDVLENGPSSQYAAVFDVDWQPLKPDLTGKVLLPVLGDQFGRVLEDGQLVLHFLNGAFFVKYFERLFPLAPGAYHQILSHRIAELEQRLGTNDDAFVEYQSILTAISHLPSRGETEPDKRAERRREKEVIKRRLARLTEASPHVAEFISANVTIFNGKPGEPRSFDLLDELLNHQAYRLAYWRVAADEINYRRFFDVNELAAVCMERPEVFGMAHALVLSLLESGKIDGLRIDHADGLFDPTGYLWQLQERRFIQRCHGFYLNNRTAQASPDGDEDLWKLVESELKAIFGAVRSQNANDPISRSLYLVVEKILEGQERLPDDWPIHGTVGYEFLNTLNQLYVEPQNARVFETLYTRFIDERIDFDELVRDSKKLIMKVSMSSELNVLGHQVDRISERSRSSRDFTLHGLTYALREVVSCFPVYRTYSTTANVLERDRLYVEHAVTNAKRRNPAINGAVFDFVGDVLLLKGLGEISSEERAERLQFVGRFQQFTGPMMAKAVEDTAFYIYNRLISLNEVGGDPEHFGGTVATFHRLNQERQSTRPWSLLATSTHDTKRSEDVRARINVLSEIPNDWKERIVRWARWNKRKKAAVDGELVPSRNDEYLLYQTLIGTWPFVPPGGADLELYIARIQQYMTKAVREAKVHSSWIAPHEAYERAVSDFIAAILTNEPVAAFRADFEPFAARIARIGIWNSLSQTLLKLTSPGVPDIYQGMELWDFSLVDPDNRRSVDFESRERLLRDIVELGDVGSRQAQEALSDIVSSPSDARIKLLLTYRALVLRRRAATLFTVGDYVPLDVEGARKEHVCAFARHDSKHMAIVIAPVKITTLLGTSAEPPLGRECWGDTRVLLPEPFVSRSFTNEITGDIIHSTGTLPIASVLDRFPAGLLSTSCDDCRR